MQKHATPKIQNGWVAAQAHPAVKILIRATDVCTSSIFASSTSAARSGSGVAPSSAVRHAETSRKTGQQQGKITATDLQTQVSATYLGRFTSAQRTRGTVFIHPTFKWDDSQGINMVSIVLPDAITTAGASTSSRASSVFCIIKREEKANK